MVVVAAVGMEVEFLQLIAVEVEVHPTLVVY
jgi:hypothetical protein